MLDSTIEGLELLKANGIKCGVISNWDSTARDVMTEVGIIDYFDNIIVSNEVGILKPNNEIFEMALDKIGIDSSNCIYIGDNYDDDIIGCEKVKMEGRLINRFGELGVEELEIGTYKNILEILEEIL